MQGKEGCSIYVCSLQGGQEKERDAFTNTSLLILPLSKVCGDSKYAYPY